MQLFYESNIAEEFNLNEEESRHAIKVLRKKDGDVIHVVNGKGAMAECIITDAHPKKTRLKLQSIQNEFEKRNYKLHIGIAPTKNIARLEMFIEKAVEIGVDEITLLQCFNSERKNVKVDRLEKMIISACKQSLKAYFPPINDMTKLTNFVKKVDSNQKLIAYCGDEYLRLNILKASLSNDTCIMIGPEGDFSKEEVKTAINEGFEVVSMGNSRLRTETAGIVAVSRVYSFFNE